MKTLKYYLELLERGLLQSVAPQYRSVLRQRLVHQLEWERALVALQQQLALRFQ